MKRPFIRGITPFRGQQRSPWLLTTYETWDGPPSMVTPQSIRLMTLIFMRFLCYSYVFLMLCLWASSPIIANSHGSLISSTHGPLIESGKFRRYPPQSSLFIINQSAPIRHPLFHNFSNGVAGIWFHDPEYFHVANHSLVGGFNPFEKYVRQIGSFPQVRVKIKNIWNHTLVVVLRPKYLFRGIGTTSDLGPAGPSGPRGLVNPGLTLSSFRLAWPRNSKQAKP